MKQTFMSSPFKQHPISFRNSSDLFFLSYSSDYFNNPAIITFWWEITMVDGQECRKPIHYFHFFLNKIWISRLTWIEKELKWDQVLQNQEKDRDRSLKTHHFLFTKLNNDCNHKFLVLTFFLYHDAYRGPKSET